MFLCDRCKNLEEIALAPSGSRTVITVAEDSDVCFSCLGLLQQFATPEFVSLLCDRIAQEKFQHKYIRTSLVLPSCLYLRQHLVTRKLIGDDNLVGVDLRVCLLKRLSYLKAAWREVVVPQLESKLNIVHLDGDGSSNTTPFFDITLNFDYKYNDLECAPLKEYLPKRLQHVKPLKRPIEQADMSTLTPSKNVKQSQFTLLAVIDAICTVPLNDTPKYFENISKALSKNEPVAMGFQSEPAFSSQAIYVHGRYRKLCRNLPQSAWTASDEDDHQFTKGTQFCDERYKSSIGQIVGEPLQKYTRAEETRFTAAGREDVDVRMLGSGRPFAIKLVNPRQPTCLSGQTLEEIRRSSDGRLETINLEETLSRFPIDLLKQGELQKEKEYTAVCFIRGSTVELPNIEELCSKLNSVQCPISLKQRTPIRVLHRRSSAIRIRHILHLNATPFNSTRNERAFILRLRAEAGTYIKEFVHGDFGRTIPNIGQLIIKLFQKSETSENSLCCCDVDIVTLDVTDISQIQNPVSQ